MASSRQTGEYILWVDDVTVRIYQVIQLLTHFTSLHVNENDTSLLYFPCFYSKVYVYHI